MLSLVSSITDKLLASKDTNNAKETKYKAWVIASVISASTFGSIYAASRFYRAKKHDNIPTLAVHDYHYFHGHLSKILKVKGEFHEWIYQESKAMGFPPVSSLSLPTGQQMIFINDPKLIKYLYEDQFEIVTTKHADLIEIYWELLGKGIFVSNGTQWKFHRKVASHIFSLRNLKDYMYDMSVKHTKSTIQKLKSIISDDGVTQFDINDILGRFTLDTFCEIAFGTDAGSVAAYPDKDDFGVAFDDLVYRTDYRMMDVFWKIKRLFNIGTEYYVKKDHKEILQFVYSILDQNMKQNLVDSDGQSKYDLLTLYKHYDPNLSDEQLKDVALNFIIAGRDTTRMLLSWFIFELCKDDNASVRSTLMKEIHALDKEPAFKDFQTQFPYLEGALCETLRLHPPVPINMKGCIKDTVLPLKDEFGKHYIIRKDDRVFIPHYTTGRCPKIWGDDALKFEPNRWKQKGVNTFNQYKFGVFNIAPRHCLGKTFAMLEAKIFMYHFLKSFDFESVKNKPVIVRTGAILNMETGFDVVLTTC